MKTIKLLIIVAFLQMPLLLFAEDQNSHKNGAAEGESWTKVLKDRSTRGTLHDAFEYVRGDSGKWNDKPHLQHAPPIDRKPPKISLDDWADQLLEKPLPVTGNDDNWLLFKTRQLDDNDRVWVERIERNGNQFTVILNRAIWQGRYRKTFTYYSVFGVNLGKLAPGNYEAKWIVKPLVFEQFEGNSRPRNEQLRNNWPKDERLADKQATQLSVSWSVTAALP